MEALEILLKDSLWELENRCTLPSSGGVVQNMLGYKRESLSLPLQLCTIAFSVHPYHHHDNFQEGHLSL